MRAVSADSLAYSDGKVVTMYGKGGAEYSWRDPPSFRVVTSLISALMSTEEQLLHTMNIVVSAHPAVVNCRHPHTGVSLLQHVIAHANCHPLIELLLQAKCRIGLQADARGRTCLHVALEQGRWRSVQQLLDAIRQVSTTPTPL